MEFCSAFQRDCILNQFHCLLRNKTFLLFGNLELQNAFILRLIITFLVGHCIT